MEPENEFFIDADKLSFKQRGKIDEFDKETDKSSDDIATTSEAIVATDESVSVRIDETITKPSFTDKGIDENSLKITEVK